MRIWRAAWVVVLAATLVFAGCSSGSGGEATTDTTTGNSAEAQLEWLFSLESGGITVFDQSSGMLSVPVGDLVGFTDRPYRVVRRWTPTEFAALWTDASDDAFSADPPNASLIYWDGDGNDAVARTVIVEITKDVTYGVASNVLSMAVRILFPTDAVVPAKLYRASLFVDPVSNGPRSSDDTIND